MKKIIFLSISSLSFQQLFAQGLNETPVKDFPNYHPLVVHFPIILLLFAAVMQIGLLFFKNRAYNYTIIAFTFIGFISGWLAATVFHAHAAGTVSLKATEIFEMHEKYAYYTIWLSGIASLIKIAGLFVKKPWLESAALLILIGSAVTVTIAGHHGAELVYKYDIGPEGHNLKKGHDDD